MSPLTSEESLCLPVGMISCKINTLDRETKSQYVVVVRAQDMRGMTSGSTSTTSVNISITDINDNFASFVRSKEEIDGVVNALFVILKLCYII